MVEIVFCRVTRRGRKKKAGMNKLARENCRNDGPMGGGFIPPDTLKITLDLSDTGPVFNALDDMMMKMMEEDEKHRKNNKGNSAEAKNALKKLLKSGIPGIEGMFGGEDPKPRFGKGGGKKGFHKMNDQSKKKFMAAIFGEEGTQIDSSTAAALLAATCSGGNPEIGNRLAELLMPEMDEKVDPAMMGALMSACSMISSGASTEEVLNAMKLELAASGLSEEEILHKTQLLMKAFGKEDVASTAEFMLMSKQKNQALVQAGLCPKDFTALVLAHKAMGACGASSESIAKILMIYSTLGKKGANPQFVAQSMKNLGNMSDEAKADCKEKILKSWNTGKFGKPDVQATVRMHQALDNENEPGWVEVKSLKDIVSGVSPTSAEAIELNLARATKSGGLKKEDIGRSLMALKAISLLGVDPVKLAKMVFLEKTICENGVPASEVARVLTDGVMPPEATESLISEVSDKLTEEIKPADVDNSVAVYNNLKFKSNIPTEVIEYVDKSLIQVRCSLEDVADNMISSLSARGEKTARIIGQVTETLQKTGATAHVVATTLMPPCLELTGEKETALVRIIGRNLKEVDYETEEVKSAVTELVLKIMEDDPSLYFEAVKCLEDTFKDMGEFSTTIQDWIKEHLPSPPTPPEEIERRAAVAAELERLTLEEEERERVKALKESDPAAYEKEMKIKNGGKPGLDRLDSLRGDAGSRRGSMDSRRGSLIPGQTRSRQGSIVLGGQERRGSYYEKDHTARATVAMVTDDPEHKSAMKEGLAGAFNDDGSVSAADAEMFAKMASSGMSPADINAMLNSPKSKGMSPESKALMQQILASGASQEEVASRVAALLAGTALSSSRGFNKADGSGVEAVGYEGTNLSEARQRKDGFEMPEIPGQLVLPGAGDSDYNPLSAGQLGGGSLADRIKMRNANKGARGSVKRQSEIVREKKKSRQEEREEEKARNASYYRKVTGLRRAKVPMMVYSCGGFSRCFRICRFYDIEGPPVGIEYARDAGGDGRRDLNPDL